MAKSKIISVIQTGDSIYSNLISRGLLSVFIRNNKSCAVIDVRSSANDVFWSLCGEKIKYIDDVIKVVEDINSVILKTYLNPKKEILCSKEKGVEFFKNGNFNYLIRCMSEIYENIVLLTFAGEQEIQKNAEVSDIAILPFEKEPAACEKAGSVYLKILSLNKKNISLIPVSFSCGWNFDFSDVYEGIFLKDAVNFELNSKNIYEVTNPGFSFKDKSESFTASLYKLAEEIEKSHLLSGDKDGIGEQYPAYLNLKEKLHKELIEIMKEFLNVKEQDKLREIIKTNIEKLLKSYNVALPVNIKNKIVKEIADDMVGLGILEDLLADSGVTEIMVNGTQNIYIEQNGKLLQTDLSFQDANKLKIVIDRIASGVGRHIDEASPIVDARLKDGSRVNAIIAPVALNGPVLTIRKFSKHKLSASDIISYGSASREMMDFLKKAVALKKNILISGGTGTGKTTLLNVVSSFIGDDERIVTVEDSAELQLQQKHVVRLETRAKSVEGTAEITIRQLVVNALRMRPDRIIVGECRSGETLDMLQAMNTGHDGSMTTVHSNSCRDAVSRLLVMSLMAGVELPEKSIISMIASAINIIVQIKRFPDGKRKISEICAVKKTDSRDLSQYELIPAFVYDPESGEYKKITEGCL